MNAPKVPLHMNASAVKEQFKQAVKELVEDINSKDGDGDQQDGYTLAHLDDGWVSYKGMSWGFVVHENPLCIDMTYGPDQPFVGFRTIYCAERDPMSVEGVAWCTEFNGHERAGNLKELATICLRNLSAKVHDRLPLGRKAS